MRMAGGLADPRARQPSRRPAQVGFSAEAGKRQCARALRGCARRQEGDLVNTRTIAIIALIIAAIVLVILLT
jgi:hypothetical protein